MSPNGYYGLEVFPYASGRDAYISNLYWRVLNRPPDQAGWDYWRSYINQCDATRARIVGDSFLLSTEFKNNVPLVYTGGAGLLKERVEIRVRMAFRTALGREPDPAGFAYWVGLITSTSGTTNRENLWVQVYRAIAGGSEFNLRVNQGASSVEGAICF